MRSIFCEDVSVTATKEDLGLLAAPPSTRQTLSLVSSPESADLIKEDLTQDVITPTLKEKILILRHELGVKIDKVGHWSGWSRYLFDKSTLT